MSAVVVWAKVVFTANITWPNPPEAFTPSFARLFSYSKPFVTALLHVHGIWLVWYVWSRFLGLCCSNTRMSAVSTWRQAQTESRGSSRP